MLTARVELLVSSSPLAAGSGIDLATFSMLEVSDGLLRVLRRFLTGAEYGCTPSLSLAETSIKCFSRLEKPSVISPVAAG